MPGNTKSPVQYFLLWAAALIWLFPGHLSFLPASVKFDPMSIAIVLALGALCLGTRWRGANDPRLLFAMLAMLLAASVSFMGYVIKPSQGLNAYYRPVDTTTTYPASAVQRIDATVDFGSASTADQSLSFATRIKAGILHWAQPSLPTAGAVNASWEGFIDVPANVTRLEVANAAGQAQLLIDNADTVGNSFSIRRSGVYKVTVRYQATTATQAGLALRWVADGERQIVPADSLSPERPNSVASDIGIALQTLALVVWMAAFAWAIRVARPRWNAYQWIATGELAVLMLLPQRALARGGKKM